LLIYIIFRVIFTSFSGYPLYLLQQLAYMSGHIACTAHTCSRFP